MADVLNLEMGLPLLVLSLMMILMLQLIDISKFAAEMGSRALGHDMQFLVLVFAGVWAWSASHW